MELSLQISCWTLPFFMLPQLCDLLYSSCTQSIQLKTIFKIWYYTEILSPSPYDMYHETASETNPNIFFHMYYEPDLPQRTDLIRKLHFESPPFHHIIYCLNIAPRLVTLGSRLHLRCLYLGRVLRYIVIQNVERGFVSSHDLYLDTAICPRPSEHGLLLVKWTFCITCNQSAERTWLEHSVEWSLAWRFPYHDGSFFEAVLEDVQMKFIAKSSFIWKYAAPPKPVFRVTLFYALKIAVLHCETCLRAGRFWIIKTSPKRALGKNEIAHPRPIFCGLDVFNPKIYFLYFFTSSSFECAPSVWWTCVSKAGFLYFDPAIPEPISVLTKLPIDFECDAILEHEWVHPTCITSIQLKHTHLLNEAVFWRWASCNTHLAIGDPFVFYVFSIGVWFSICVSQTCNSVRSCHYKGNHMVFETAESLLLKQTMFDFTHPVSRASNSNVPIHFVFWQKVFCKIKAAQPRPICCTGHM